MLRIKSEMEGVTVTQQEYESWQDEWSKGTADLLEEILIGSDDPGRIETTD